MFKSTLKTFALLFSMTILAACGGGGGGGGGGETASPSSGASTPPAQQPADSRGDQVAKPAKPADNKSSEIESHTVTLSWTAPSTREDNSPLPLSEIEGYEIFYFQDGSTPEEGSSQRVSGGSTTRTTVTVPTAGTYFFAVAAVDRNGLVSDLSNYVTVDLK
jgi:hypothetical protein